MSQLPNVESASFDELKKYYDEVLNTDKSTYKSNNDEPTPIDCVSNMISKLPEEVWSLPDLSILDPCCGNGNFFIPIFFKLLNYKTKNEILSSVLEFNDINKARIENVRKVFCADKYPIQIHEENFIEYTTDKKYDLIVANPPYAKLMENGKRASKNHNLIKDFINKALSLLKPNGYILFITPDNWMSYADRNTLIKTITELQIIHLDIHSAKKYFRKIGSSFTWYIIQNCLSYTDVSVSGIWKKTEYECSVVSKVRSYIPLFYNPEICNILEKTVDNALLPKFGIKTSSNLHKYTKKTFISTEQDDKFKYKLIHTPNQIVYSSCPHKFQEGYKVFLSTTDKYKVFVDNCGMTQSIAFILCSSEEEAYKFAKMLEHPLYVFINNICRWGNFNNIRILQNFPMPQMTYTGDIQQIYSYFNITPDEIKCIEDNI